MSLLDFNKPKKMVPHAEHIATNSTEGIAGAYVPNMSREDMWKWKVKHVNKGKPNARIELKKTYIGTQVFIIVALDGWDYKHETIEPDRWGRTTKGLNVRMSMNGPILASFAEFDEINQAIEEATKILKNSENTD